MTKIVASKMKIAEDGRRTRITIRPVMGGKTTRRSRLGEEELVKETEEDHRRHRPEEMEINLVVNPDRRVSLMVMYRVPRLLKCFPLWLNVSKNRRDHLLRRSQRLKIPLKSFPALKPIYVLI